MNTPRTNKTSKTNNHNQHRIRRLRHKTPRHHHLLSPETHRDQGADVHVYDASMRVYLVVKRKPLAEVPVLYRWLARWVYFRIGWASDFGVEYQGVYTDEAEARYAASSQGMSYTTLPLNGSLPEETCQFSTHDFPLSDASIAYRRRQLPLQAVPVAGMEQLRLLEAKLDNLVGGNGQPVNGQRDNGQLGPVNGQPV